jgi:methylmalonyl-CoA mutase
MSEQEKLFKQFPPVSTEDWMEKIGIDLKGADFNQKLIWKTNEGFDVKPFYRNEETQNLPFISSVAGNFPFVRGNKPSGNTWLIRQSIEVRDFVEANEKALDILMKGVDSLGFIINDSESINEKNIDSLLKGIYFEGAEINFLPNGKARELLSILIQRLKRENIDLSLLRGSVETDPLGRLMVNGNICIPVEAGLEYLASLVKEAEPLPNFRVIRVNGSNFTNAGTDIVKELAFTLAMAAEYLTQLTDRGISPDLAASKISFTFGTGSNYFFEIAKLRAARLLWSGIASKYEPNDRNVSRMNIHSVTGRWNKTLFDPHVNLLRTQTEAMSAILGGADSVTVEPFDVVFREPDDFSERIARNQQLLLKEEAYFDKTADPAGGSYYIENLTALIAESVWTLFVTIEDNGGYLASLKSGMIQNLVKDSLNKRKNDITSKKEILLGTNKYPDLNEKISPNADLDRLFAVRINSGEDVVEPLNLSRGAEELEKLRISSPEAFKNEIGNKKVQE